ncbi:class I SAM-dependent methyltransferase [Rhodospirillaceae bacterium KN72]|uniref:Class I SAM-dependent methyltransferase n=1 Tax=Pacificispira spongiicola TaxID=2729598 RepID=A0A7Y0HFG2_9PROT|nr:class I SAM-dependent methyltransferase [Pacificispira spongiicola]NMM45846.1 class I SAM-dependent methyltransferase [Pacificispira spongiicola]
MTDSIRRVDLSVEAAYDRWAESYDGFDNPMIFIAEKALTRHHADVSGQDIVEFGCGTGRNLEFFATHGAHSLTGLDLSDGMLEKAATRNASFRLIRQDLMTPVPLPDVSADLVLFCLVLEHIDRTEIPLAEARRLLKPGGRIVVIEIHPYLSGDGIAAHFKDGGEEVHMPTYPHQFADHLNAFAQAGLTVETCREWRPKDLDEPIPQKLKKRGDAARLVVEFVLKH